MGDRGITILRNLFESICMKERIPNAWRKSVLIPIYKQKGDIKECGNYRGIKLMSHTFKLWERVVDTRIRSEIIVSKNQFGFMPGRSGMEALFAMRQLYEKYNEKQRELRSVFIDLEKAYDTVPRILIWNCLRKAMCPETYIRWLIDMYEGCETVVKTAAGNTEEFRVGMGLHQGSVLSPFLFVVIMEILTKNIVEDAPWSMLFADDIVLNAETDKELEQKLEEWRSCLEDSGLKISRAKTVYMGEGGVKLEDSDVERVECFKYLGSKINPQNDLEPEVSSRVKAGWANWRKTTGILCDKKVPLEIKGKVYKSVVRPSLLYGSETWSLRKDQEKRIDVNEMRMLRFSCGVTKKDRVENRYIRGSIKVTEASKKLKENKLRWYGHIKRRDENELVRKMLDMDVQGRRRRGRPKKRWMDGVREEMRERGIEDHMTQDRNLWKKIICYKDPE